jgi:hypothetical protein
LVGPEGYDVNNDNNLQTDIIGFGNACLTSYTISAEVGTLPTVEIGLNGLNIKSYKNPEKQWGINYKIDDLFTDNFYDARLKIVNYDINNDLIIISEPNRYLYSPSSGPFLYKGNQTNGWSYTSQLTGVNNFTDGANSARYGRSLAASNSGKYIVIGGPDSDNYTGSALLYTRNGNNWNFVKKINGINNNAFGPIYAPYGARYGTNVLMSRSGDIMAMVGPYDNFGYGGALIYTGDFNAPSYKITGSSFYNLGVGASMNANGNVIILGGGYPAYFDGLTDIFTGNKNNGWKLAQSITGENGAQHGSICAINDKGDIIALGGLDNTILIYTGNALNRWDFAQKITGVEGYFYPNLSMNFDGSTIVVGNSYNFYSSNGIISIYTGNPQTKWGLSETISGKNSNDQFGQFTAINYSGNTIAVTAPEESYDGGAYNGVINILNKINIKGLPSIDPETQIDTNQLYFRYPEANSDIDEFQALTPGSMTITYEDNSVFGYDKVDLKLQSFSFSFDLNRTPFKKIGKQFPFAREIDYPVKGSIKINAIVGDLKSGNLSDIICGNQDYRFFISFISRCEADNYRFFFQNARLISQDFISEISANYSTMNATYEVDLSYLRNASIY